MTDSTAPHKSRSFQDCKETDIHGYNDCPSFLFNVSKKNGRKNRLQTANNDTYGNTKLPITPPPPMSKRKSDIPIEDNDITTPVIQLTQDDILNKINQIINKHSNLSSKEYEFYKRKVDLNLPKSISNDSTKVSLSQLLEIIDNKTQQADFLRKWMLMDITISNWCPAFLKLVENVQD